MKRALGIALGLLTVTTVTTPAFAGERTSLSDLPVLSSPKDAADSKDAHGVPGLTVKQRQTPRSTYHEVTVARAKGYCLVDRDEVFDLETYATDTGSEARELWQLVEKDGAARLERTRYQVAPLVGDDAWVLSRSSVTLKVLATDLGVTVWGMREANGDVVILAKRATSGRESAPAGDSGISFTSSSCTFGAVRVRAASLKAGGGSAQLSGQLPAVGEGKARVEPTFVIDVSVVKVSRDPEPVVSVRVRKGLDT